MLNQQTRRRIDRGPSPAMAWVRWKQLGLVPHAVVSTANHQRVA